MKRKIYIICFVLIIALNSARGQNMSDGINISANEYFGSARSMALGNAVTAIGGDLGTIGINPAGSAVANYGQFTISVGSNTSKVNTAYSIFGDDIWDSYDKSKMTKLSIPNIAISSVFNTGAEYGLKSLTFAFAINQTADYTYYGRGLGYNPISSKIAELAVAATDFDHSVLSQYNSFYNSNVSWDILTAYQGGQFSRIGNGLDFAGVTEGVGVWTNDPLSYSDDLYYMYTAGELKQTSLITKTGSKNDMVFNFGANFSDRFFLGLNLGLPCAKYSNNESFYESSVNPDEFQTHFVSSDGVEYTTNFVTARNSYQYISNIQGVYAKLGAIYTFGGLRLGAAIQTPTFYTVNEKWKYFSSVNYSNSKYNTSQESPEGEYSYNLRSPFIANFGLAYIIGQFGLISADYQITDYSSMKFNEINYNRSNTGEDLFLPVNSAIRNFAGQARSLRLGVELKALPSLSLRAGFNYNEVSEYYYEKDDYYLDAGDYQTFYYTDFYNQANLGKRQKNITKQYRYSAGIGYSSPGSFFLDLAASWTKYPDTYFYPYDEYLCFDKAGNEIGYSAPSIKHSSSMLNIILTLGWRF